MINKTPMEFSPFVGPDSLREATRLMKALYDSHTKRYCGYEDINGSPYVGTVENFGAEIFLEARKILMDKPSLKNIFIENTFDFYFDIQFSNMVNTYDQQNMLSAVLKKNVFLSNKTYQIRFDNVKWRNIPRAKSSSDPNVVRDRFLHTITPPHLVITEGSNTKEIELKITDKIGINTNYYFHIDYETSDMFDESVLTDIDEIKSLITKPITDNMYGREFVWICIDTFKMLPEINLINNELDGKKILTIGSNGHDNSLLYPLLNHTGNDLSHYLVKVIPDDNDAFTENRSTNNFNTKISKIHIMYFGEDKTPDPGIEPDSITKISYNDSFVKMTLFDFDRTINPEFSTNVSHNGKWFFRRPRQGDFDYDGRLYHNPCYAYTSLACFFGNTTSDMELIPLFSIKFDDKYLNDYEELCGNATTGIHVDVTSDHSDNGVSKKNGVIYNMGDFDGLPTYFQYMIDDTIHRAHIEAYAVRDKLNDVNQLPNEKQTAGIIIDSAIPQNEIQKVSDNLPISIKFDMNNLIERVYKYDDSVENSSKTNYLSEITYIDENNFGNVNNPIQKLYPKFIYHGNRHFSLGMMGFDPELETGRVYIISNDKASYDNNEISEMKKAPITFARICDIPTDFSQLVNIKNIAPTLVIDPEYVRMFASFSNKDKEALYNLTYQDKLIRSSKNDIIFNERSFENFNKLLNDQYPQYYNINESIDIFDNENVVFDINSVGTGYNVNDMFSFYIGGINIKGIITETDEGSVVGILYENKDDSDNVTYNEHPVSKTTYVTRSNFKDRLSVFDTKTISGTGSGLTIKVSISESLWDSTEMVIVNALKDSFYLEKNSFGDIWSYTYDDKSFKFTRDSQLTGCTLYENRYDMSSSASDRTTTNCFIYNMINPISNQLESFDTDTNVFISNIKKADYSKEDLWTRDFIDILNNHKVNVQNGLFLFDIGYENVSNYHNIIRYEIGHVNTLQKQMIHPAYSDLSYSDYTNKTNKLRFKCDNDNSQPSLYLFDPTIDVVEDVDYVCKDVVKVNSRRPILLTDVLNSSTLTPDDVIDKQTGVLNRNIYISDEFDLSFRNNIFNGLNNLTREGLINYLKESFPDSEPLKFEGSGYEYSKRMIINYIMENNLLKGISAKYTNGSESIYRRPEIKLFRRSGEQVFDKLNNPIGEQPKGSFKEITSEKIESKSIINNVSYDKNIMFIFRIDDNNINLDGVRVYDEDGNDVSNCSMLIVNGEKYVSITNKNDVIWLKIIKEENNMKED